MTLAKELAFGVVPVRKENSINLFLLVQHVIGHWAFPKGHPEPNEAPMQTALRELREETGISSIKILSGVFLTESFDKIVTGQPIIRKTVGFFIGTTEQVDITVQPSEIKSYCWATYQEALDLLTYTESKKILNDTLKYLQDNNI